MNEMGNLTAVTRVFLDDVTAFFIRKHKVTRKFTNLTGVTACTADCSIRSPSYNNIGCTANKSVSPLQ